MISVLILPVETCALMRMCVCACEQANHQTNQLQPQAASASG